MLPGFSERLEHDLNALTPPSVIPKVIAPEKRKLSVWMGGSILASGPKNENLFVSREEYEEAGPTLIHSRWQHL